MQVGFLLVSGVTARVGAGYVVWSGLWVQFVL